MLAQIAQQVIELSKENEQLKQALESRPVVDQARGVLIAVLRGDEDAAWQVLLEASQHANVPLRQVAEAVVASAAGEPLPSELEIWVRKAMRHVEWERHGKGRQG